MLGRDSAGSCEMPVYDSNRSNAAEHGAQPSEESTTHLLNGLPQSSSSLSPDSSLCVHFPTVTITLADVLPVAIVVAVQCIHYKGVCPYPPYLFIDVLAKVSHVKHATSIVQVRVNQVSPEAFEHG
jgi:hypothetical protein